MVVLNKMHADIT